MLFSLSLTFGPINTLVPTHWLPGSLQALQTISELLKSTYSACLSGNWQNVLQKHKALLRRCTSWVCLETFLHDYLLDVKRRTYFVGVWARLRVDGQASHARQNGLPKALHPLLELPSMNLCLPVPWAKFLVFRKNSLKPSSPSLW